MQARNAKSKGGQSATMLFAYTQYLFGMPIVVTVDLDAPDAHLVDPDHEGRSRWLCKNCEIVRLKAGDTFYKKHLLPDKKIPNTYSLFTKTLAKRRRLMDGRVAAVPPSPNIVSQLMVQRNDGPPAEWLDQEDEIAEENEGASELEGDVSQQEDGFGFTSNFDAPW